MTESKRRVRKQNRRRKTKTSGNRESQWGKGDKSKRRTEKLQKKGVRVKLNCRLREAVSSLFPSLFYLSHVKPRLPPFTCQCIYNSELSAPGCVGGETSSSLCQHRGLNLNGPDRTGCYWTAQNRCVDLCLCPSVHLWEMTACVCDRLFLHRTCFQSSISRRYSAVALP